MYDQDAGRQRPLQRTYWLGLAPNMSRQSRSLTISAWSQPVFFMQWTSWRRMPIPHLAGHSSARTVCQLVKGRKAKKIILGLSETILVKQNGNVKYYIFLYSALISLSYFCTKIDSFFYRNCKI